MDRLAFPITISVVLGALLILVPGVPVSATEVQQQMEADGFTFQLHRCQLNGKNIVCELTVTSPDQDRDLKLIHTTRIFDDAGNEYKTDKIEIANKIQASGYSLKSLFVAGLPTRVRFHFSNVSTQARAVSLLEVHAKSNVKFRDIPL